MAVIDSKQKMLGINELIQEAYENEETHRLPLELEYPRFVQEAMMPNSYFLRYGNTIFVLHGSEQEAGMASMRIIKADTDENFVQALYSCFKDSYEIGYYLLVVREKINDSLIKALDMVEKSPPNQDFEYIEDEDSEGTPIVAIVIGDPDGTELKQPVPIDFPPPNNAKEAAAMVVNKSGAPQMPAPMGGGQMPSMQQPAPESSTGGLGQLQNKLTQGEV